MSVRVTEVTYFSHGVGELYQSSKEAAEAFRKELIETLVRGGKTAVEAEQIASSCETSRVRNHFDIAVDRKTVTVRMTLEEFELVRATLGMEHTDVT